MNLFFRNTLKQEQTLIEDSKGFSSNLVELVADVKESKSQCQILVEKVQAIAENSQKDTERGMQARETQINGMYLPIYSTAGHRPLLPSSSLMV